MTAHPIDYVLQRAQAHLAQEAYSEAQLLLTQTLEQTGPHAAVWTALGVTLRFQARPSAAAQAFEQALALEPHRADAQVYLGMLRLAQGQQDPGWELYRARWRAPHWPERLRYPANALWQGRVRAGTRLLLWGEQGLGDSLQFARYAPWLQALLATQGASLVLEVPKPLVRLLQANWPALDIAAMGQVRGNFDAHLPMMDLPQRWGGVGEADGLLPFQPMPLPYLTLPGDRATALAGRPSPTASAQSPGPGDVKGGVKDPLRVGIVWQGRPSHPDDRIRSIAPALLEVLFAVPGVSWVSLQKDAREHPAWLPRSMDACADFLDTASVLQGLDLVISIDSAVAHLAGALGKPVWLLLPPVADWRWGLEGEATPWYPGMRLVRRTAQETWQDVLLRVAAELATLGHQPRR